MNNYENESVDHTESVNVPESQAHDLQQEPVDMEVQEICAEDVAALESSCDQRDSQPASYTTMEEPIAGHRSHSPYANSPYEMPHLNSARASQTQAGKRKRGGKLFKRVVCAILFLAILAGGCFVTANMVENRLEEQIMQVEARYNDKLAELEKQIENAAGNSGNSVSGSPVAVGDGLTPSQVYAANVKSVVLIYAEVSTTVFGQVSKSTSTGSGFVLTENGYIVTNYHVVENATSLRIITHDDTSMDAELIGADSANDVALLKVAADSLDPVTIGSSSNLIVGDQVVAIGNPLGELTSTLTVGYVSAKERDVSTDGTVINMIQTDAAINSGNSGGPLFNMKGEVVGITTAKYSGTSNSGATIEGIGFAIPIDDVYDMLDDLMNFGYITGAYMGIEVSDTNAEAAAYFGYPVGAYVHSVENGSCAEKAGLKAKDVIVGLGDYDIGGLNDLSRALRKFDAGDTTSVTVYRSGQEYTLEITFDAKPQSNSTAAG